MGVGSAAGLIGAVATARLIGAQLVAVGSLDPVAFAVAVAMLGFTAFVAGALPAFRATRVNPVDSLKGT